MKVFLLTVFLSLIAIGCSIKCDQCTNCEAEEEPKECKKGEDTCQTITTNSKVNKACSVKATCKEVCDAIKKANNGTTCDCCQEDGCNGGVSITISTIAMIVPAAVAITYYF